MRDFVRPDERLPVSQETAGDDAEQRTAPRFTLLIRAAKLIGPEGEYLCVVRDASESGVSVRLFHPLPATALRALENLPADVYRQRQSCSWHNQRY